MSFSPAAAAVDKAAAHAVDVHVGRRLRLKRTLAGLSQTDLAGAVGLTFQQIQKYEKGANRISAGRLVQFAGALGVPVSFFFDGGDGDAPLAEVEHERQLMMLARAWATLTPAQRRSLLSVAQACAAVAQGGLIARRDPSEAAP